MEKKRREASGGKAENGQGKAARIRLAAMDLDGTLLTTDKELSSVNRAALERAAGQGIILVPATGRIWAGFPEILKELPFFRYAILANGAQVLDRETETVLYRAEMSPEKALEVLEWLKQYPAIFDCYQENRGWMTKEMWEQAAVYAPTKFYAEHIRTLRTPVPDLMEHIRNNRKTVQKIQAFCTNTEDQQRLLRETAERFPELAVTTSVIRNAEINDTRANKGDALAALAAHLNIPLEETAAFGDGSNDLSMIRRAGTGVAMGNAIPEVLQAADCRTDSNDEDGVGRMLNSWTK